LARVAVVSAVALLRAFPAWAQVPATAPATPASEEPPPPPPPPPPAAQPEPAGTAAASPAAPLPPPPLEPPPVNEPTSRPPFLHTREEMERMDRGRSARERPAKGPMAAPAVSGRSSPDYVRRASPWIDFALTNFYLDDRVDNFFNLGVQVGAYLFEHLRVSGRLVAPLEEVRDSHPYYSTRTSSRGSYHLVDSRSISVLYGASVGLVITNSRSFVFGPSIALLRTDVEAYGSAWFVTLPFEWTTQRNLRIGFEFGLGHAFDGKVREACLTNTSPTLGCGVVEVDRPGGTALLAQFYMGWALGKL
jgi:hypothetical protein